MARHLGRRAVGPSVLPQKLWAPGTHRHGGRMALPAPSFIGISGQGGVIEMRTPSLSTRFATLRGTRAWRGAAYVLGGALLCEVGARISFMGPNGETLSRWFHGGQAGPLLRLYDTLAGFGMSRGTVAALGFMPYVSARTFTWLARSLSAALDRRWSHETGRVERTRCTRGLTFALALVQSYGFARFTQTIPGVVLHPGAQYLAETMLVQTAAAMFMMWIGEQVTEPAGKDAPTIDPPLLGQDGDGAIFTSGQRRNRSSPDYIRRSTPAPN